VSKKLAKVFVSIGSNIEPERHIENALKQLESDFQNLEVSKIYSSKSVGFEGDNFLNLMVSFDTELEVTTLYDYLHKLEDAEGRERPNGKAWDSRTLDLDIMLFGELPSQEILTYAHVYLPLMDLNSKVVHPESGECYSELVNMSDFNSQEILLQK